MNPSLDKALQNALPPLLTLNSGQSVETAAQWQVRRTELLALASRYVYGDLPPMLPVEGVLLHQAVHRRVRGALIQSWRFSSKGQALMPLRILLPAGPGPFPALVCGDACWAYATDAVQRAVLQRGVALVLFNRVDVMSDVPGTLAMQTRCEALQGFDGAAVAAWAWSYHRVVDVLLTMACIRPDQIAVVGHSRGGKAALLAGATDERIGLTSANNSGAGGAGCWRFLGPGAESLKDISSQFPAWFSPVLGSYADRVEQLPFDQHMLKALIAPRYLLTTEALGDRWANPQGSQLTHDAALPAYRLLNASDRIAITFRQGRHAHTPADWASVLAHMQGVFDGVQAA